MTIERFFSIVPEEAPALAGGILAPVLALRGEQARPGFRITLFGAVKTGKTGMLNRLLGTSVVPEDALKTKSWITTVAHNAVPSAMLRMRDGSERAVPFDELQRSRREWSDREVGEVRIGVPHPVLSGGITLVDTPGLLADEAATEITYGMLERTDLSIMVLAADKILSGEERAVAAYVHDLLHGNIVFVVNRMDLINEEDRDDVLAWASAALSGLGNSLLGQPRILISGRSGAYAGRESISAWLTAFSESGPVQSVSTLSRSSVLGHRLSRAVRSLQEGRGAAVGRANEARMRHLESTMRERAVRRRAVGDARRQLDVARVEIASLRPSFISRSIHDTSESIRGNRASLPVRLQLEGAITTYADAVNDRVRDAVMGAPVNAPPFDLRTWLFRLDLNARPDPVGSIGSTFGDLLTHPLDSGKSGREAGEALGSWISKNVLGKDAEMEMEQESERLAHTALVSIEAEVDRYFSGLSTLLDEADSFYEIWVPAAPVVDAAEEDERCWAVVLQWAQGFERAARRAADESLTPLSREASEPPPSDPR